MHYCAKRPRLSHLATVILVFFELTTILLCCTCLPSILISNDDLVEISPRVFPLPKTVELTILTRKNSRDVLGYRFSTILHCVPEKETSRLFGIVECFSFCGSRVYCWGTQKVLYSIEKSVKAEQNSIIYWSGCSAFSTIDKFFIIKLTLIFILKGPDLGFKDLH